LADGLDRGHAATVDGVDVESTRTRVRLMVTSRGDMDLELWGLRRKRELFERLFERLLEVVAADHPSLAAQP
jgi:exopolyphosphatase/guanosine-5'-triphosphate,3'-diphosphate pyrophosphatase